MKTKFLKKSSKKYKRFKSWFKYYFKFNKLLWVCVLLIILSLIMIIILSLIYDWNIKMIYGSGIGICGIFITTLIYWRQLKNEIDPKLREWNEWKKIFDINSVVFDLLKFEFVFLVIHEILKKTDATFTQLKIEKDKNNFVGFLLSPEEFQIPGIDLKYFNKLKTEKQTVLENLEKQLEKGTICDDHANYINFMNKYGFLIELENKITQLKLNIYKEECKEVKLILSCFKNSHKIIRIQFLDPWCDKYFVDILLQIDWNNEYSLQSESFTNLKTIWEEMKTIRHPTLSKIDNVLLTYDKKNKTLFKSMKKLHASLSKIQSKSEKIFMVKFDQIK